jgi:hypothetical protein
LTAQNLYFSEILLSQAPMEVFSDSGNSFGKVPSLCRYSGGWFLMQINGPVPFQCGSEPARDSGLSFNPMLADTTPFASRLAPTGICGYWGIDGKP